WELWAQNHPEGDPITRRIRKVESLQGLGSEVMAFSADVADEHEMQRVISNVRERFGEIDGVIHAAGETSPDCFPLVHNATRVACERHFAPKIRGLYVLDNLLQGKTTGLWVLVSSLSSILGGLGYAAYSAANNFLDAFAIERGLSRNRAYITINWDGWVFEDAGSDTAAYLGQQAILRSEGVEAFRRVLTRPDVSQIAVSVSGLGARIDQWVKLKSLAQPDAQKGGEVASH